MRLVIIRSKNLEMQWQRAKNSEKKTIRFRQISEQLSKQNRPRITKCHFVCLETDLLTLKLHFSVV